MAAVFISRSYTRGVSEAERSESTAVSPRFSFIRSGAYTPKALEVPKRARKPVSEISSIDQIKKNMACIFAQIQKNNMQLIIKNADSNAKQEDIDNLKIATSYLNAEYEKYEKQRAQLVAQLVDTDEDTDDEKSP